MTSNQIKTSDLFVDCLIAEGVKYVFGIPGEENLDFVQSMKERQDKIKLVLFRHEQAGGFAAAVAGRLTGLPGVCLSTLGPGATNFTTSAAYAHLGGFPMMMITGQKPIKDSKQANFQIVNVVEMMRPITKYTTSIAAGNMLASSVRKAFTHSVTEKPGPVHIELAEDIAAEMAPNRIFDSIGARRPIPEKKAVKLAVETLLEAKRPVVIIGAAANRQRAINAMRSFIDETGLYWCTTQMGKGVMDERHPRFLGATALSDKDYCHGAIDLSDVILMVGHDETEKPPFIMKQGGKRKVIHLAFTPALCDNVYDPNVQVIGDLGNGIYQIHMGLKDKGKRWDLPSFKRYKELSDKLMEQGTDDSAFPMNIARVIQDIRNVLPEDGILSLDNGLYKVAIARAFKAYLPNTVLLDNALASMGVGIPGAIACKFVHPHRKVVSISGDGGALMNFPEMATCVQYGLDVVHIVLNDNAFGMIKWKQANAEFESWGLDLQNPSFAKLAEAYGASGHLVKSTEEFAPLLAKCLETPGTHVIEVPFSYEWFSAKLKEIPGEVKSILSQVEKEFGIHSLECCLDVEESEVQPETINVDEAPKPSSPTTTTTTTISTSTSTSTSTSSTSETDSKTKESTVVTPGKEFSVQSGAKLPFYLGGKKVTSPDSLLAVTNKYDESEFCQISVANKEQVDQAISIAATSGTKAMRDLAPYVRQQILQNVVDEATRRREEFAYYLAIEAGKPIKDARGEADRLIQTFQLAAEEATRMYGEYADLQIAERAKGFSMITKRFPIGPVSLISPFNFPLNLAAHKVAPAIAAGCPFVLKPASKTPLGALMLAEILANDPRMPSEGFSVLPCSREAGNLLTTDERIKLMSFTGSPGIGFALREKAGKKNTILELGGNAACVVDDLDVGLSQMIGEIVHGAFYQSGQSCISVQRLLVNEKYYEQVRDALVAKVRTLKAGNPLDESTFIGPVISESEAKRIESWIKEASEAGANVLCGGDRFDRVFISPAVVENVPHTAKMYCQEVFGPAVCIESYADFKDAIEEVNNSVFGLQAGVYTSNFNKAHYAFENIDCGGVCINSTPSVRIDSQPYGGQNNDSGIGKEGIKYALQDYTELKVMVMKNAGKI